MSPPIRYEIEHVSRFRYSAPVRNCVMAVCLRPLDDERQQLLRFTLTTDPPAPVNPERDAFGNLRHVLNIHRRHDAFTINTHAVVVTLPAPPPAVAEGAWDAVRAAAAEFSNWDYVTPTALTQPTPAALDFARGHGLASPAGGPLEALQALMDAIHGSFRYVPGVTSAASPVDHVLQQGEGVCQDFTHLMLAIVRTWGVPARYVSGYVDLGAERSGASHAWVECLLPPTGWVGFDPTNRCLADERHIRIAVGRDYQDVAPTRGVLLGAGESTVDVHVRVRQLP